MENMIFASLKEIRSPESFQVLSDGRIDIEGQQPAYLDAESAALIINHFQRRGNDMVIDYEHQTLKDVQAPAAGWVKRLAYKGSEGLWAFVEWTAKARDYIINKEYRYFSPVISIRKSDRKIVSLENVALTNAPRINNLVPLAAKLNFKNSSDIDFNQKLVNDLLGVSEEVFLKYNQPGQVESEISGDDAQRLVNKLLGISDELFLKYNNKNSQSPASSIDENQRKINKMLGISDEEFLKYNK